MEENLDGARLDRIWRKTLVWHNDTGCPPELARLITEEIGKKGEDLMPHMTPLRWIVWIKAIAVSMFLCGYRYASGVDFPEKDDKATLKKVGVEELHETWKNKDLDNEDTE